MRVRKIGDSEFLVRIKKKHLILNESGLYLLKLFESGIDPNEIILEVVKDYSISKSDAESYIYEFAMMLKDGENYIDTDMLELNSPISVQWKITNQCNLNCRHCYNRKDKIIESEKRDTIFNRISELNPFSVLFTGGEPLMLKDTMKYMKELYNQNVEVRIFTNGTLLSDYIEDLIEMKDNLIVNISLDGGKVSHELLRGENTYDITLENIEKLSKNGVRIAINTVITKLNYKEYMETVKALDSIGVESIQFSHLTLKGNAIENMVGLQMEAEDYKYFDEQVQSQLMEYSQKKSKMEFYYKPYNDDSDDYMLYSSKRKSETYSNTWECCAGRTRITIDSAGDVYPCSFLKDKYCLGNAVEKSIDELWRNEKRNEFLDFISRNGSYKCALF